MALSAGTGGGGGSGEATDIQDKTAGQVVAAKATMCTQRQVPVAPGEWPSIECHTHGPVHVQPANFA